MKLMREAHDLHVESAAAFGRLCVETQSKYKFCHKIVAAAFGRLCVETYLWPL